MSSEERAQRILEWCRRVPTRYEREDPFAGDGFQETQTGAHQPFAVPDWPVGHNPPRLPPRPPAHVNHVGSSTLMRESAASVSPQMPRATNQGHGRTGGGSSNSSNRRKRALSKLLGLFSRKRKEARPPSPPAPLAPPSPPKPVRLNFLFVGSHGTGQTSLLFRSRYGYLPDDTSGAPDLNTVERLASIPWHGVFLCFDLGNKITLLTIVQWWTHVRTRGFNAQTQGFDPLVRVVGMKRDLRRACAQGLHCPGPLCHSCCVSPTDASANAHSIRAEYIEVSAKTGENMDLLLHGTGIEATRLVLAPRADRRRR